MSAISYSMPRFQAVDDRGRPMVGAMLYTYENRTTTLAATWKDSGQAAANTNPIELDARGEAVVWLAPDRAYTFALRDRDGVLVWSQDDVVGITSIIEFGAFKTDLASPDPGKGAAMVGVVGGGYVQDAFLSTSYEVTAGSAGDFQSINKAIETVSRGRPFGKNVEVVIRLLSGFVMQEQVFVKSRDLSYITIVADDAEVLVDRDWITEEGPPGSFRYPIFYYGDGAYGPALGALFRMTPGQDWSNRHGLRIWSARGRALPGCGVAGPGVAATNSRCLEVYRDSSFSGFQSVWKDAGDIGVRVANNCSAFLTEADLENCTTGAAISNSHVALASASMKNARRTGCDVQSGSVVNVASSDCSGAGEVGLSCIEDAAVIDARNINVDDCVNYGIRADGASLIGAENASAKNAGLIGLSALRGAKIVAPGANCSGSAIGAVGSNGGEVIVDSGDLSGCTSSVVRALSGGRIRARGITGTGCTTSADVVRCWDGSEMDLQGADISGAPNATFGISCDGSFVNAMDANCRRGVSDAPGDIRVGGNNGGVILAEGATGGTIRTPNVLSDGGDVIRKNLATRKSGFATVTSGATSTTVNHGLGVAPLLHEITATPTSNMASASKFWISSVTSTTFDINVDVAPGANISFAWRAEKLS